MWFMCFMLFNPHNYLRNYYKSILQARKETRRFQKTCQSYSARRGRAWIPAPVISRELAALGVKVAQNCVARLPITIIISSAHRRCRQVPSCCCCGEGPGADASLVASTAFGSIFQALGGSLILILEPRFIRPSLWVTGFSLECRLQSLTSFLKYGTSTWESGRHLFFL